MGGINWGNAGSGAAAGGAVGGPFGAVAGGVAGALGWDPSTVPQQFGQPGKNNFRATPWQNSENGGYNPAAFQGGWNDPNSAYNPNALAGQAGAAGNAVAPWLAGAQGGLGGLAGMLQGQANGTAPSIAMEQLRQAQQTNAANTMGLMASARGVNPAQAALNAAQVNAQGNQNVAAQGVQAQLAERNAAQGMLGNIYQTQGQLGLQQQGQNNSMVQYFMSLGMGAQQAQLQANIAEQNLLAGSYNNAQGLNAGVTTANAQNSANLIGGLLSGAGALGAGAISGGAMAGGGVVPGYNQGGVVGCYSGGGMLPAGPPMTPQVPAGMLEPMPLGLVSALRAQGGVLPGVDTGVDTMTDGRVGLRPGEVVVNQENPIYPVAKAAVQGAAKGGKPKPGDQPKAPQAAPESMFSAIARAFGMSAGSQAPSEKNAGMAAGPI